jgi:hypothetical protein
MTDICIYIASQVYKRTNSLGFLVMQHNFGSYWWFTLECHNLYLCIDISMLYFPAVLNSTNMPSSTSSSDGNITGRPQITKLLPVRYFLLYLSLSAFNNLSTASLISMLRSVRNKGHPFLVP